MPTAARTKWSIKDDILSVGPPQPDIMGLPTGKGSLFQIKLDTSTTFYCSRKLIGKVKLSLAEIEIAKPKHNGPVT